LQARHGRARVESVGPGAPDFLFCRCHFFPQLTKDCGNCAINEGKVYRIGELKIEGNSIFSEQLYSRVIGLKTGDIADGKRISDALFKNLKELYGSQGLSSTPRNPPHLQRESTESEGGYCGFVITIEEGKQFTLRRLEFLATHSPAITYSGAKF